MGDWTGTVPLFAAGAKLRGTDMQTMADISSALTGAWTTWTPTYANLTITTATIVAKYRRVGKAVDFRWKFKLGASSAVGTVPSFTLPFAASADFNSATDHDRVLMGWMFDNNTAASRQVDPLLTSSTIIQINHMNSTPTSTSTSATVPWTWATDDVIDIRGLYYTD